MANLRMPERPRVAVHKFSSCDGCQLAFLNAGATLLDLAERVEFVHFAEAGVSAAIDAPVDIAFVEGSISTHEDEIRIARIREHSRVLIAIGACATSGGVQALRNLHTDELWHDAVYPEPALLDSLDVTCPVSDYVHVDLELWGCPVTREQVLAALNALCAGVAPREDHASLCLACKARGAVCTLVTRGEPCLGPVTRTGCGALCPRFGRACYGCFGPTPGPNTRALGLRLNELGLSPASIARRFHLIHSGAEECLDAGDTWKALCDHRHRDGHGDDREGGR